ncbi:MAG TPA: hypothetical protein PKA42_02025 [Candidatus Paceibacterota bacterium]|nr:hypothetical protein [Candidatus Paceibacterota bacterium]HMO82922.1 hypothetical protein [Candidatus Paceibacterota bacterium]
MSDEKQEGQKTIVSFIVGLLIGGLLVWAFSGPEASAPKMNKDNNGNEVAEEMDNETNNEEVEETTETETSTPVVTLPVGDGKVTVVDQAPSSRVALESVTYPISEGWIGVRDYQSSQLGSLLGVARFSESQGLVPNEIILQRSTVAGRQYAVVLYTDNGDRQFNLADDVQVDTVFATFTAN